MWERRDEQEAFSLDFINDVKIGAKNANKHFIVNLLHRSPESAKIKQKMVYTSSKDALKRKLLGIAKEVQACDHCELSWTNVLEHLLRSEVAA